MTAAATPAFGAETASVTVDGDKPVLKKLDTDGWSTKVGLINLTEGPVTLSVRSRSLSAAAGCTVQFVTGPTASIPAAHHADVTVTYSQACRIGKLDTSVRFVTNEIPPQSLVVAIGAPKDPSTPNWGALWVFPISLAAVWLLLMIALVCSPNMTFCTTLPHLPATWKFSDSWATNVTAVGGVLTGVVGSSDVAKAFLGEDADSAIALAIVGAAVAAAFVVFGGVVVQALKGPVSGFFTAGGFITAASVTLAGAFGELYVVYATGKTLDLGGWENRLAVPSLAAAVLLCVYAANGLFATLRTGTVQEASEPLSEATVAAAVTTAYCCSHSQSDGPIDPQKILDDVQVLMAPKVERAPALWRQRSRRRLRSERAEPDQAANAVATPRFAGRSRAALL